MDDREYLDVGRPKQTRRRWTLVVVPVVVVLAALGVARGIQLRADEALDSSQPSPAPQLSSTPTSRSVVVAPPNGTLVVATAGGIAAIDLGSGTTRSTSLDFDASRGSMTAAGNGVVVSPGGKGKTQILVAGAFIRVPTPSALAKVNSLRAATDSSVWAARVDPSQDQVTWRLADLGGRVEAEVRAAASVISDGQGGLLEVDGRTVRQVYPKPAGPRLEGAILGVGPDGYILRPCADPNCPEALNLYTRSKSSYSKLDFALPKGAVGGTLSSNNRFVALPVNDGATSRIEVRSMTDGTLLRTFPQGSGSRSGTVWLDQRWVALVSEGQVVLFDAVAGSVATPAPELSNVGPIAWQAA